MYNAAAILEGGGMRGTYTTGVIDAFLENDIEFASVYGVSAGACHGSSLVSRQHGRAFRLCHDYLHDKNYCGLYSLFKTGNLFGAEMLFTRFHHELDLYDFEEFERYQKRGGEFVVVATDLKTGDAVYHAMPLEEMIHKMLFIQASSSMPLVSRTVEIDGGLYLDGCIGDSIPVRHSISKGCMKNVVVLTRPRGYRKSANHLMPIIKMKYKAYPNFVARSKDRHIRYNETLEFIEREEEAGRMFVIAPSSEPDVQSYTKNAKKLEALYDMGYKDTCARMDELISYLEK